MSVFYKEFLDDNRSGHIQYNLEWQRRNFKILALSVMVWCQSWFKA